MSIITRTQQNKDKYLVWIDTGDGNTIMQEVDKIPTEKQAETVVANLPKENPEVKLAEVDAKIAELTVQKTTLTSLIAKVK